MPNLWIGTAIPWPKLPWNWSKEKIMSVAKPSTFIFTRPQYPNSVAVDAIFDGVNDVVRQQVLNFKGSVERDECRRVPLRGWSSWKIQRNYWALGSKNKPLFWVALQKKTISFKRRKGSVRILHMTDLANTGEVLGIISPKVFPVNILAAPIKGGVRHRNF